MRIEGDKFVFPGGGTSFPRGVEWYVGQISKVVPLKTGEIRTVLDIGCGVSVVVTRPSSLSCFVFLFFFMNLNEMNECVILCCKIC